MNEKKTPISLLVARWTIAALVLVGCFALGLWLGGGLSDWSDQYPTLRKGVPALGLGLMLALLSEVLVSFSAVLDFIKSGSRADLWAPGATVFVVALTIAFALQLLELTVAGAADGPRGTIVVWNGRPTLPAGPAPTASPGGPYAVFKVFFPGEASGYDPRTRSFATGTTIGPGEEQLVRRLARGLANCAGEGQDQVKLSVRGFASSSGYAGMSAAEAEILNLLVAHSRADAVVRVLRNELGDNPGIWIERKTWESAAEMVHAESFPDTAAGEYNPELGFLNRRVDVLLDNPGGCRVVSGGEESVDAHSAQR